MRVSVSRTARWVVRTRGGQLYLWEEDGEIRAATKRPGSEAFSERPGDGFVFHVERSLECPRGIHIGLRPWSGLFAREGPRGGSIVWQAIAVEHHIPDGGTGSS
jgi:hypothetical protein